MRQKTRKPTHPGTILEEHYIKPLGLNLYELASHLGISRNTLFKIRAGKVAITTAIAVRLAEAFRTTPNLWLNLQQKFDIWCELYGRKHKKIIPLYQPAQDCNDCIKAMGE